MTKFEFVKKLTLIAVQVPDTGSNLDKLSDEMVALVNDFETQIRQDQKEKNCSVIDKIISGELDIEYAKKIIMEADQ